jgi:hypothetical protein
MRNAERVLADVRNARRSQPKERDVWIRIEGEWRSGEIDAWFRDGHRWFVAVSYEEPGGQRAVDPRRFANYWYDPLTIIPRRAGERPIG